MPLAVSSTADLWGILSGPGNTRVVNMGTSSKKSKRNFVPMVHPGTLEVVPMVKRR